MYKMCANQDLNHRQCGCTAVKSIVLSAKAETWIIITKVGEEDTTTGQSCFSYFAVTKLITWA